MIEKRDFIYSPKGSSRPLHIWLPEDYDRTDERYPVMYFFDGHNLFLNADATYGKSWGMKEFLEGWGKKLIIVGIECSHKGQERLNEYLPYCGDGWLSGFEPQGQATMDWITEQVKPMIDREFRTIPFRECTAIGGSSMGGIMALFAAIRYNRWFSKAACVSSSIGCCMASIHEDIDSCAISPDTRVYLSWGTREAGCSNHEEPDTQSHTYHNNRSVAEALTGRAVSVLMDCQMGGGHCEADWEKLVPTFMNYLWMQ